MKIFGSAFFLSAMAFLTSCISIPPAGSPETGYSIYGYIGKSPIEPAPSETILLLDKSSGQTIDSMQSDFFGKYMFKGLHPGVYLLKVKEFSYEIVIRNDDKRIDVDLSAPEGKMDYAKAGTTPSPKEGKPVAWGVGPCREHLRRARSPSQTPTVV